MVRTSSTAMIYGDKIKDIITERELDQYLVILPQNLKEIVGYNNRKEYILKQIENNANKKIIIVLPLFLKEFSFIGDFTNENHRFNPYFKELLNINDGDYNKTYRNWLENKGKIGELIGPNPRVIALKQLKALKRLNQFIREYIKDRPLIIGAVGHGWSLDVLRLYLINKGSISVKAFDEKLGGELLTETEMFEDFDKDHFKGLS